MSGGHTRTMRADQAEYYARLGEVDRLTARPRGRLEYLRTREILESVLQPRSRVLDVGGGTGIHARWLAENEHVVTLIDPVPEQVEIADRISGVSARVGDARELDVPDASVDAVLLLGPLYHLVERSDRVQTLCEAGRVVRPGGFVIGAVIPRQGVIVDMAAHARLNADTEKRLGPVLQTGRHDPTLGFTSAYFHALDEIAAEFAGAGLVSVSADRPGADILAVEGVGVHLLPNNEPVEPELFDSVMRLARATQDDPELFAGSSHLLGVARRPALDLGPLIPRTEPAYRSVHSSTTCTTPH